MAQQFVNTGGQKYRNLECQEKVRKGQESVNARKAEISQIDRQKTERYNEYRMSNMKSQFQSQNQDKLERVYAESLEKVESIDNCRCNV